jgi:hypothetical protein
MFHFDVFYMFRTRGFIFKNRTQSSIYYTAFTDACKMYHTITAYTTVFLKINRRVRNV